LWDLPLRAGASVRAHGFTASAAGNEWMPGQVALKVPQAQAEELIN
jgi:hypothetical protein